MSLPADLAALFLATVVVVLGALAWARHRYGLGMGRVAVAVLIWLVITGVLAGIGFFADFKAMPPRLPLFLVPQLVAVVWLVGFSRHRDTLAGRLPLGFLTLLQAFRIPVELVLAGLATRKLAAVELSFHGRNFDIVAGVLGLLLGLYAWRRGARASRGVLVAYNLLGLGLLLNIVGHGILSAPYPFQVLRLAHGGSGILATFPLIWLPFFLVPVALALHVVSLRRLLKRPVE
jgi:hypothetical protein